MKSKKYFISCLIAVITILILLLVNYRVYASKDNNFIFSDKEKKELGITSNTSIEIFSNPNLENQYFVKVIQSNNWDELLYRVVINNNQKDIELLTEGSILDDISFYTSKDNIKLPDKYLPLVLTVTSSTHMGNGGTNLYVFTKDGNMENLLYAEETVDKNLDSENGIIYKNNYLSLNFQDNKDESNYSNIIFSGEAYQYGIEENRKDNSKIKEVLYQNMYIEVVYSYDKTNKKYIEISNDKKILQTIDKVISFSDFWKYQANK